MPATAGALAAGGPADADARTHVVVSRSVLDDPVTERVGLSADAQHHCARVLRLRPTDRITLTDGGGRWAEAVLAPSFGDTGEVILAGPVRVDSEPPDIGIAFALTKGDKPETVVQKLTELGVRRIIPVRSVRSIVKWDVDKADRNTSRLVLIARAALEQSRGVWSPIIEPAITVAQLAGRTGVVRADRGGRPLGPEDTIVAIGPEGGWDLSERELLPAAVGLPGLVLRAETAAIVAGALLVGLHPPGGGAPVGR